MLRLLGSAFGLGLLPFAPGTFGTVAGVGLALVLPGDAAIAAAAGAVLVVGTLLARAAERRFGEDPRWFVLDEVAGYLLAVLLLPRTPWILAGAFVAFRAFDILKPWPIRRTERLGNGVGVMADDVVAALYAQAVLRCGLLAAGF